MKKIGRILLIQLAIFFSILGLVELFSWVQIRNGHLFHFEAVVDSRFYPQKNTRDLSPHPDLVKMGVFPPMPQLANPAAILTPLQFSFTYTPQVADNQSYGLIDHLPFFIQIKTERFRRFDDIHGLLYDVEYGIDEHYRRVSTPPPGPQKEHFLILAGCSYTFGSGLENNQTLASVINQNSKKYEAYNYGMRGASPGDVLFRLRSINKKSDIKQKSGTVIYVYIDDHMSRLVNDLNVIGTWGSRSSYYQYTSEGDTTYLGSYEDIFPLKSWFYKTIFKTNTARYFFLGTYNNVKAQDFATLSELIKQMQKTALDQLGAEKFYVLLYPGSHSARYLARFLESKNIHYIDYSNWDMFRLTDGQSIINYDGHPTSRSNELLGRSLQQILEH